MKPTVTLLACATAVLPAVLAASPAGALVVPPLSATPGYRFVTVDPPGSNGQDYLTSILPDGTTAGSFTDASGVSHGFVRSPSGPITTVDFPGAASTFLTGINTLGVLAGTFLDSAGAQHGFVRSPAGTFRQIDVPGADPSTGAGSEFGTGLGTAVASSTTDGTVVGDWGDANAVSRGFLLTSDGHRTDLDAPGATTGEDPLSKEEGGTIAIRMNHSGAVVGSYSPSPRASISPLDVRAVLKTGNTWTTLLPAGASTSQAFGLTDGGEVGGVAFGPLGVLGYGWLWKTGRFTRIDPQPLALYSTVADINPSGVITGEYATADFHVHGYIGYPLG
jgi:hypothetical protein